ncbi:hypothetical protein [Amycolatopsis sp. NPDC004625]|uniref:hypothetical protein n=1 Tax=Amycolatopsis sp. NPDC004625 TaxID=3154670 RepID=UPI0033AF6E22
MTATHRDAVGTSLIAFERFVRINHVTVFRLAACLLGDAEKAEDVVEDLFVELWCRKDRALSTAELLPAAVDRCLDRATTSPLHDALRRVGSPERTGWLLHDVLNFPAARTAELLARTEPGFGLDLDRTRVALSTFLKP